MCCPIEVGDRRVALKHEKFIRDNADKGALHIAKALGISKNTVTKTASKLRVSLKVNGKGSGRNMSASLPKKKTRRQREIELMNGKPLDHPIVQYIYASRNYSSRDVLRTSKWKKQRQLVLRRDGHQCQYCGDVATCVDHVIPRKAGGDDSLDNLVASCTMCNSIKSDKVGVFSRAAFTPPAFVDKISPIRANHSKSLQNGHTTVRIDPASPFIDSDQSGAN